MCIRDRFSELAEWIEGTIQFDMNLVRYYREHHGVNTFLRSSKIDEMGGLPRQAYYDGIHELDDDEALILETPLPSECRYCQAAGRVRSSRRDAPGVRGQAPGAA